MKRMQRELRKISIPLSRDPLAFQPFVISPFAVDDLTAVLDSDAFRQVEQDELFLSLSACQSSRVTFHSLQMALRNDAQ